MKKLCAFLIIGVLILIANYPQPKWNEVEVKEFNWQPFTWIPYEMSNKLYDKAAIFVPIQFEDSEKTYWLQLDTGTNSQFDGVTFESVDVPFKTLKSSSTYNTVSFNGKIAGYETQNAAFLSMKGRGEEVINNDEGINIGSLGMDFFKGKILMLDFPNKRLAIATSTDQLPNEITDKASFFPAKMIGHLFSISLTVKGTSHKIAYDTGSSVIPLLLNQDFWQQITGRDGRESDSIILEGPAWGNMITLIGAPSKEEIFLSGLSLGYSEVYYREDKPDWFKGSELIGIMGNEPFYDDYIVILDGIGMRFGLVKVK